MSPRLRILLLALAFEAGLGLVALGLGSLVGVAPFGGATVHPTALALGALGALPPFAAFLSVLRSRHPSLLRLREVLRELLSVLFAHAGPLDLVLVSCAAGFGEEALFRGLLQRGLEPVVGTWLALAAASLAFGLAHAVTLGYAVFATLMGAYLGLLYAWSANLWVAVSAHAIYDALALWVLLRRRD